MGLKIGTEWNNAKILYTTSVKWRKNDDLNVEKWIKVEYESFDMIFLNIYYSI